MPQNLYDAVIEQMGSTPAGGNAPPRSIYDDVLDARQQAGETQIRASIAEASSISPEKAAEAHKLSLQLGIPPAAIERNFDAFTRQATLDHPYAAIQQETPATAEWLKTPDNAKLAHDDLENLGALEWIVTAPQRAFAQGIDQVRFGRLRYQSLFRPLTQEEQDQLNAYKFGMSNGGALGAGNSWFRQAITGTAQQLPNLIGASAYAAEYGAVGAVELGIPAAAAGSVLPGFGTLSSGTAGASLGFRAGAAFGAGKFTAQLEAGNAYDEYLGFKDENGQPLAPEVAKAAALATGVVNAGLEVWGLEKLAESVPGIKRLQGKLAGTAVKTALRNPSVRAALTSMMAEYGKTLTAETFTEVAQRAVTIMAGELGKVASGQSIPLRSSDDVLRDLWQEGTGALSSFALMVAPGPLLTLTEMTRQAKAAEGNVAFFTALGEGVSNSKLAERAPDKLQELLASATKNGPVEHLYADTDQWAAYWQGQGLDPAAVATEVTGDPQAFAEAAGHDRDLKIPTAAYAAKVAGTPHNAALMQDLRLQGPDSMTAREAAAFRDVLLKQTVAMTPEAENAAAARQVMVERLRTAGASETTANTWADVWVAGMASMASDLGIDPLGLQSRYGPGGGPTVSRPGIPAGQQAPAIGGAVEGAGTVELPPVAQPRPDGTLEETPASAATPTTAAGAENTAGTPPAAGLSGTEGGQAAETAGARPSAPAPTDQPIAAMSNIGAAALRMIAEDPDIVRKAQEMRDRAAASRGAVDTGATGGATSESQVNGPTDRSGAGQGPEDGRQQRSAVDAAGEADTGTGDERSAERRRLPAPDDYPLEPFRRAAVDDDAQRLTPAVKNELTRIADELDTFPYEPNVWAWEDPAAKWNLGNAAGGKATIVGGNAGAPVYDDILTFSPLNKGKGDALAKMVRGTRGDVLAAVRQTISSGRIWNNLAEGAVRVAERREAGDYRYITRPQLPASWGVEATEEFLTDLQRAVDTAITTDDLLNVETDISDTALEEAGGDTSFDPSSFDQGLFDDEQTDPTVDTLTTGEQQPRLPGAEAVRETETATPEVAELPFALTSETSKAKKGKQTTLFQGAKPEEMIPGEKNDQGVFAVFRGWQEGAPPDIPSFPIYDIHGGDFDGSTVDAQRLEAEGIPIPPTPAKPTEYFQGAYHGSPHVFEQFSLHAIGSGEGAQAYGWGLYFASRREVADRYREQLAGKVRTVPDIMIDGNIAFETDGVHESPYRTLDEADQEGLNELQSRLYYEWKKPDPIARIREQLQLSIENTERDRADFAARGKPLPQLREMQLRTYQRTADFIDKMGDRLTWAPPDRPGRTYKVDIPDDDVMLDWDRPASQQPPKVQAALKALGFTWQEFTPKSASDFLKWFNSEKVQTLWNEDIAVREALQDAYQMALHGQDEALRTWQEQHQDLFRPSAVAADPTGERMYRDLSDHLGGPMTLQSRIGNYTIDRANAEAASKELAKHGVVGIRYLDGFSRTAGEGSHNYVVFDDKLVQITEYDQSLPLTPDLLDTWATEQKTKYGPDLAALDVYLTKQGDLKLDTLAVNRGANNAGLGTRVMEDLTRFADAHGARIILSLAQKGYEPIAGGVKTTSRERLKRFYKRFGFVENSGRNKDFAIKESMYREPTAKPGTTTLAQEPPAGGRRGAIRFGPDRQFDIALFEKADLSTFLHETGHFFLEVFGDVVDELKSRDPATLTDSQKSRLQQWDRTLEFLGVDKRSDIGVEQHEKFARAFEAYLMEGKAPSIELRSTFARVRSWMLGIYRALRNLNVDLTPEVRGVFDRLLASEEAIKVAEAQRRVDALFLTPDIAGMSDREFSLYRATIEDASRQAREELDRKLMAEVTREQQAEWKARRADVEAEVTRTVHDAPVYRALAAMQRGTNPDGSPIVEGLTMEPLKLSKDLLVERFGVDRLKRLPRPPIYSVEGGLDPDFVAQRFGFETGDAMLTALEAAEPMRTVIQRETDNRMLREHGSLLLNGEVHDAARLAVSNDYREQVIRQELRALAKLRRVAGPFVANEQAKAREAAAVTDRERAYERRWLEAEAKLRIAIAEGRKQVEIDALEAEIKSLKAKARGGPALIRAALPPAGMLREVAQTKIAGTIVSAIKPQEFWTAARRSALKAVEAAARQDFDGAIAAKQQELFNLEMFRAAEAAREEVKTIVSYVKSLSTSTMRAKLGLAGETFQDQVDAILDRYQFAKVSQKALDRRASLRRWIAAQQGEGLPVNIPDALQEETRRVHYSELTVEELRGVRDGLQAITHLAQLKNRLLRQAANESLSALAAEGAASIAANGTARKVDIEPRQPKLRNRRDVRGWMLAHRPLLSLLRQMDGFADGFFFRNVWQPAHAARNAENTRGQEAARTWLKLHQARFAGEEASLYAPQAIPGLPFSLSTAARLAVALNYGNEGNRERMRAAGIGNTGPLTDAQQRAILDTLTARDWAYVRGVAAWINSYKQEIGELQKRVEGVEPTWVEPTPFQTLTGGEMPGWYYPIAYEGRASARALPGPEATFSEIVTKAAYTRFTTAQGHNEARSEHTGIPLRADLGVIGEHVEQVIHDLTHREMLLDIGRLLGKKDIQDAIYKYHGDQLYNEIKGAFRDVAIGPLPAPGWYRMIGRLRRGSVLARLAWNVGTIIRHVTNIANGMVRVGKVDVARAIGTWLTSAKDADFSAGWIADNSQLMANRWNHRMEELAGTANQIGLNRGQLAATMRDAVAKTGLDPDLAGRVADTYLYGIHKVIQMAEIPTWIAAYRQAREADRTHADAVASADNAVLDAFGGGDTLDLAGVQRSYVGKIFTTFMTYGLTLHRQNYEIFSGDRTVAHKLVDATLLNLVPTLLLSAIFHKLHESDWPDEVANELWAEMTGMFVFVRELAGALRSPEYQGPAALAPIGTLTRLVYQTARAISAESKAGEKAAKAAKTAAEVVGQFYGVPVYQVEHSAQGIEAIMDGKTTNPLAVGVGAPKQQR